MTENLLPPSVERELDAAISRAMGLNWPRRFIAVHGRESWEISYITGVLFPGGLVVTQVAPGPSAVSTWPTLEALEQADPGIPWKLRWLDPPETNA